MKTVDEALTRCNVLLEDDPVVIESFKELMNEPGILRVALNIADGPDGQNSKVLLALCLGFLVGIESQR